MTTNAFLSELVEQVKFSFAAGLVVAAGLILSVVALFFVFITYSMYVYLVV